MNGGVVTDIVRKPGSPVSAIRDPVQMDGVNAGGTTNAPLVLLERGAYYLGNAQNILSEVHDVRHQLNT